MVSRRIAKSKFRDVEIRGGPDDGRTTRMEVEYVRGNLFTGKLAGVTFPVTREGRKFFVQYKEGG